MVATTPNAHQSLENPYPPRFQLPTPAPLELISLALQQISPPWTDPPTFSFKPNRVIVHLLPKRSITDLEVKEFVNQLHRHAGELKFTLQFPSGKGPIKTESSEPTIKAESSRSETVKPDLKTAVRNTIPTEVELLRPYHYELQLPGPGRRTLQVVVPRVYIPDHAAQNSLERWKNNFRDQHGALVLIAATKSSSGITGKINQIAGTKERFLTSRHRRQVYKALESLIGVEPEAPKNITVPNPVKYAKHRFQAWDPSYVLDREDCFHVTKLSSGNFQLLVGIVDNTDYITPGSSFDRRAERLGTSLYFRNKTIHTLGRETATGIGSFQLGEPRPAWVVELFVSPDGRVLNIGCPGIYRESIAVQSLVDPKNLSHSLEGEDASQTKLITEVGLLLHAVRNGGAKMRRIDEPGLGSLVVGELMIATQRAIGTILSGISKKADFKVHERATQEVEARLISEIRAQGIAVDDQIFNSVDTLISILSALDFRRSARCRELLAQLIEIALFRSRHSSEPREHCGLGIKGGYATLKGRDFGGLTDQFILRSHFGSTNHLLSEHEIERRVMVRNQRQRLNDELRYQVASLTNLYGNLALEGERFAGSIEKIGRSTALIKIPGFRDWGVLRHSGGLLVGDQVEVSLLSFSKDRMRYVFQLR